MSKRPVSKRVRLSRVGIPVFDLDEASIEETAMPLLRRKSAAARYRCNRISTMRNSRLKKPPPDRACSYGLCLCGSHYPALLMKHFLPLLPAQGKSALLPLGKVGSIGDNHLGGWYSYRASSGAQSASHRRYRSGAAAARCDLPRAHPGTVESSASAPFEKSGSILARR